MPRLVILGPPRTGKTTYATSLAKKLGQAAMGIEVEHMTPPELTAEERRQNFSEAFEPEPETKSVDLEPEPEQDTA